MFSFRIQKKIRFPKSRQGSVVKFSALGHATQASYGGPKFDFPDFPLDFVLWNFASDVTQTDGRKKFEA